MIFSMQSKDAIHKTPCEIIARIETERAIVHGNRELIRLYEEKVKKVIERVWEG